jgi:CBS domain-containing membrane protein
MNSNPKIVDWFLSFWPQPTLASQRDRLLGCIGAAIGLFGTEWLCRYSLGSANPWFIAPMGASAVLLFGVPASPLAQPWSIVGGNLVAALIGVAFANLLGTSGLSCALAVAAAIALMFPLRCLHPPSGAVALTAILGGPAVHKLGYGFVLAPVLVNSLLLATLAVVFNNLANRRYPHNLPPSAHKADATQSEHLGVTREDLHAALVEQHEMLDISEDDLEDILIRAEAHAHQRRLGGQAGT